MDWKTLGKKLLHPPVWLTIILSGLCAAALVLIFVYGLEQHVVAYGVYVLSFYMLVVISWHCAVVFPKHYRAFKQKLYEGKLSGRYMTDAAYRIHVSLYLSLSINFLYVVLHLLSGFWYQTNWFYVLAAYYGILAVMRFLLVRYIHSHAIGTNILGEWERARICACILTLVNLSLSGVVLMMMYQDRGYIYHGILIYVMAMYTFYITIMAVIDIVRYRKYQSPVMTAAKSIHLAAALVSMLSLETAMLTAFGAEMELIHKKIFIAATGAGICVIVTAMSGYMIVRSTKEIETMKRVKHDE